MSGIPYRTDQRLAFAVTRFIEEVHEQVPQARLEPMTPYEDLTLRGVRHGRQLTQG